MGRRTFRSAVALLAVVVMALPGAAVAVAQENPLMPDPEASQRLAGPDRIATSVAIWQDIAVDRPEAVLARADTFPDALAGGVLAAAGEGPLLLTRRERLSPRTAEELVRIMRPGGTVFLAGSEQALFEQVAEDVRALGFTVRRIGGPDRYGTAVELAELANDEPQRIYIANGTRFADALVAGHTAARDDFATMVLTAGATLPPETAAYLDGHPDAEVVSVGSLAASTGVADRSVVGADRYETSRLAAEQLPTDEDDARVALATGERFPDALSGGTHAALTGQPLLLVRRDELPGSVAGYLEARRPSTITVYGGPPAVDPEVVVDVALTRGLEGAGGAAVYVNEESPVDATACERRADDAVVVTWFESELTLEFDEDLSPAAMQLRAAGRDGRTTDVEVVPGGADDVAAYRGTFDATTTEGIREVLVTTNVGYPLCS